jgi:hypothetical protein
MGHERVIGYRAEDGPVLVVQQDPEPERDRHMLNLNSRPG